MFIESFANSVLEIKNYIYTKKIRTVAGDIAWR